MVHRAGSGSGLHHVADLERGISRHVSARLSHYASTVGAHRLLLKVLWSSVHHLKQSTALLRLSTFGATDLKRDKIRLCSETWQAAWTQCFCAIDTIRATSDPLRRLQSRSPILLRPHTQAAEQAQPSRASTFIAVSHHRTELPTTTSSTNN